MASTELGASVLTGVTTPGFTVAGAGLSPTSTGPFSESMLPVSTVGDSDGSDIAPSTFLRPLFGLLSSTVNNNDASDLCNTQLAATSSSALSGAVGSVLYYKMRGMDHNTAGLYDTWIVLGAPDYTSVSYTGGLSTPLRDVVISAAWSL